MAKTNTRTSEAPTSNRHKYLQKWATLSGAGIGVIVTRTREPWRAMNALWEYAVVRNYDYRTWTRLRGWGTFDMANPDPDAEPTYDGTGDFVPALLKINAEPAFPAKGIYCMMWPHRELKGDQAIPHAVQCIAEYSRVFAENKRRLVLIVPDHWECPPELIDCVTILDFEPPSQGELRTVYEQIMEDAADDNLRQDYTESDVHRIVAAAAGLTTMEAEAAISRALVEHKDRAETGIPIDDFVRVISEVKVEAVKRTECLTLMPPAKMSEVGGLDLLKEWVRDRRNTFSEEAREYGVDKPKGVMLIGPPGTAKSLSAKAIAHELGIPLIRFDVSAVFNSLVGSSEARVRGALKMLDAMAPCVVMIDEIDKVFQSNSGGGDSGVGMRVMGAVLTHLQDGQADLFWVGTANRTDTLPAELLRKGRFDEVFAVSTPEAAERVEIARIHLEKRNQTFEEIEGEWSEFEAASHGYVGAEIENAVKEAVLRSFNDGTRITVPDLCRAIKTSKPLSEAFAAQFQAMQEWAENNARPASGTKTAIRNRQRAGGGSVAGKGRTRRRLDTSTVDG